MTATPFRLCGRLPGRCDIASLQRLRTGSQEMLRRLPPLPVLCALAVVATACGAPSHKVEQLRFSDNGSANVEAHPDTFDARFEMGHSPFVHGHLDISYGPGWWSRRVTASCELTGPPESGPTQRIDADVPLPYGRDHISWPVLFSPGPNGLFRWVEGKYSRTLRNLLWFGHRII